MTRALTRLLSPVGATLQVRTARADEDKALRPVSFFALASSARAVRTCDEGVTKSYHEPSNALKGPATTEVQFPKSQHAPNERTGGARGGCPAEASFLTPCSLIVFFLPP